MKICVFGTGYVGLVSGVCLADMGHEVTCIDKDATKVDMLAKGIPPIYEPGLAELMTKNRSRLSGSVAFRDAVIAADVIMIAVGTPFDGKKIDLTYIRNVASEIGEVLKDCDSYKVVTVKSTVIPGTTDNVVKEIVLRTSGKNSKHVGFCMNPEFLREGCAVEDFMNPDRIVLGVDSAKSEEIMRRLYEGYETDIVVTNPATAEMIKYTANSYLALNISFANEISLICEQTPGVDSVAVFNGVVKDKRISPSVDGKRITPAIVSYLKAGCGFGGSCFPKDVQALSSYAASVGVQANLLKELLSINESRIEHVFNLGVRNHAGPVKSVSILGTAFKPNTDDIREAPGIKLAMLALEKGYSVKVQDYIALENTRKLLGDRVQFFDNPLDAVEETDVIYLATAWSQYRDIADSEFKSKMKKDAVMVDSRFIFVDRKQPWRIAIG